MCMVFYLPYSIVDTVHRTFTARQCIMMTIIDYFLSYWSFTVDLTIKCFDYFSLSGCIAKYVQLTTSLYLCFTNNICYYCYTAQILKACGHLVLKHIICVKSRVATIQCVDVSINYLWCIMIQQYIVRYEVESKHCSVLLLREINLFFFLWEALCTI